MTCPRPSAFSPGLRRSPGEFERPSNVTADTAALTAEFRVGEFGTTDVDRDDVIEVRRQGDPVGEEELRALAEQDVLEIRRLAVGASEFIEVGHLVDGDRRALGDRIPTLFEVTFHHVRRKRAHHRFGTADREQVDDENSSGLTV